MITISESPITKNFLVLVDGVCIDSSIHWGEALKVKLWLVEDLRYRPLKRGEDVVSWLSRSNRHDQYPQTTAEVFKFDPATNQFKKGQITL